MDFNQKFPYHPLTEKLLNVLESKTLNNNAKTYFRTLIGFYFSQMASNMRCNILSDFYGGRTPVNMYCMCFMQSGAGKGLATGFLEENILDKFIRKFKITFNEVANITMTECANQISLDTGIVREEALRELLKEFRSYGAMPYSFDSGTSAAFKQVRTKAQMAGIGALSFICDELGSVITNLDELLIDGLVIFDKGRLKQKITKNTAENQRAEERDDPVPCNMLLFGEPGRLFDGALNEKLILEYLRTGYARRSFFATGDKTSLALTPEEIYERVTNSTVTKDIEDISNDFGKLADSTNRNKDLSLSKENTLLLIEYRSYCQEVAKKFNNNEENQRNELEHRYYKVLKLAGAYAFVDGSTEVTKDHILAAIQLAEDSGECFAQLLKRDKPYVKLAKYIANAKKPLTHADLSELPYYPQAKQKQNDLLALASAWGYDNNIAIKRYSIDDGVEFLSAVCLPETNLNEVILSYSTNITQGYLNEYAPFNKLDQLCCQSAYYWCNHHLSDFITSENINTHGYRDEAHVQEQFNLLVLDCDHNVQLDVVRKLLSEFTYFIHTTKRHQIEGNGDRFRIVLPMKYTLSMGKDEYQEFMKNVFKWLPFELDEVTHDRCRAWKGNNGLFFYNDGVLFDPRPMIPKTVKNIKFNDAYNKLSDKNLGNLERWFISNMKEGSRNSLLHRYALVLKDMGKELIEIETKVKDLNSKIESPLKESEIDNTIMKSIV